MRLLATYIFTLSWLVGATQDFHRKEIDPAKLAEEIFPVQDEDLDYSELYENWLQQWSHPADLNRITAEELRLLMILSEKEINAILRYREQLGAFESVYELQAIPELDQQTCQRLAAFVKVQQAETRIDASLWERMKKEKNHYLLIRYDRMLEEAKGFRGDSIRRYGGAPDHMVMRYRLSRPHDFSVGFTVEKDPGEEIVWSPPQRQAGFDYLSWHLQLNEKGKWKNILVGDFQAQFGQGLMLGSAFGFGKNAETITTVRRSNIGFMPYTSLSENQSFHGVAVSFALSRHWMIHGFASKTYRDGVIKYGPDSSRYVTSLTSTGLHRSSSELSSRKQVDETDGGAIIQFKKQGMDAGFMIHHMSLSVPLRPDQTSYNQFEFRGSSLTNAGCYYNLSISNFAMFAEAAHSIGRGWGVVGGLIGNVSWKTELSVLFRKFDNDFVSFYSNAFAESSQPQNETGLYGGFKHSFSKKYAASAYIDLFQFPWLRYRSYAPSEGSEWLARFTFSPNRSTILYAQIREEWKDRNKAERNLYQTFTGTKRNYWLKCDLGTGPWTLKTAIQWSTYTADSKTTSGFGIAQDIGFQSRKWSLALRYAIFDTEDFDNRLYFYERDIWLGYSFPAYYGRGIRRFVLFSWRLNNRMDCWLRWSGTTFTDRAEIGSGSDQIAGNTRNDVKFQLRILL